MSREYGPLLKYEDGRISALDRVFKDQAALDKHFDTLERVAGRELRWQELRQPFGIHQSNYDLLSEREKIRDSQYIVVKTPVPETPNGNPFEGEGAQAAIRRQQERFTGKVDRAKLYKDAAKEWQATQDAQQSAADAKKAREPLIVAARALADRLRFDPQATLEELRLAVRATKQSEATDGCMATAREMIEASLTAEAARFDAKQADLQNQIENLKAQMVDRPTLTPGTKTYTKAEFMALHPSERAQVVRQREEREAREASQNAPD